MKKILPFLLLVVIGVGVFFMVKDKIPTKKGEINKDLQAEAQASFDITKEGDLYYPVFSGQIKTTFVPDKVTVDCNETEKTLVLDMVEEKDGTYTYKFRQSIVYDLLAPGVHDADVKIYKDDWILVVPEAATLQIDALEYYEYYKGTTINGLGAMVKKTSFTTESYTGIKFDAHRGQIIINGTKTGSSFVEFAIVPETLYQGEYELVLTVESGTVTCPYEIKYLTIADSSNRNLNELQSMGKLENVGDTNTLTFRCFERTTLTKLVLWVNHDNITFDNFTISYTLNKI